MGTMMSIWTFESKKYDMESLRFYRDLLFVVFLPVSVDLLEGEKVDGIGQVILFMGELRDAPPTDLDKKIVDQRGCKLLSNLNAVFPLRTVAPTIDDTLQTFEHGPSNSGNQLLTIFAATGIVLHCLNASTEKGFKTMRSPFLARCRTIES